MPDEPRVIEAEVVSRPAVSSAEKVKVSRLPAGMLLRGVYNGDGGPEGVAKRVRELKLRLWLWLAGFAAISAGCFVGAAVSETILWAAFLIVAGLACACAMSVTWLLIWALRRLQLP